MKMLICCFESRQEIEAWMRWSIISRDMAGKRRTLKTSTGHPQRSSHCRMGMRIEERSREDGVKNVSMRPKDVHATLSCHSTEYIYHLNFLHVSYVNEHSQQGAGSDSHNIELVSRSRPCRLYTMRRMVKRHSGEKQKPM